MNIMIQKVTILQSSKLFCKRHLKSKQPSSSIIATLVGDIGSHHLRCALGSKTRGLYCSELGSSNGLVDGGFQSFPLILGDMLSHSEENGENPRTGTSSLGLNELKLYETANLLLEEQGKV